MAIWTLLQFLGWHIATVSSLPRSVTFPQKCTHTLVSSFPCPWLSILLASRHWDSPPVSPALAPKAGSGQNIITPEITGALYSLPEMSSQRGHTGNKRTGGGKLSWFSFELRSPCLVILSVRLLWLLSVFSCCLCFETFLHCRFM